MAQALHALAVVARLHHVACNPASLRHHLGKPGQETVQPDDLLLVAKQIGLRARRIKTTTARLPLTPLPALALLQGGGILRAYVFSHTTSRIDVELGSRLFRHLLNLPLSYFESRRVGNSVARVRELENIRAFLTGNALTLVLDVVFSVLFVAVMLLYSVKRTLIVLISLPLYFLLSLLVVPVLRVRLEEKFNRGAQNQALRVESISAATNREGRRAGAGVCAPVGPAACRLRGSKLSHPEPGHRRE